MSNSGTFKKLMQVQLGTLHVGVDLALEKNMAVVINEQAERLDRFSFPQDRGGYDYFLQRTEKARQKYQAAAIVVAMVGGRYHFGAVQLLLEADGPGTGREGNSLSSGERLHREETSRRESTRSIER